MKGRFIAVCIPACSLLLACQSLQGRISGKEDMLAAAGFKVLPANTPERESELETLPINKFVTRAKGDHVEYLYADRPSALVTIAANGHHQKPRRLRPLQWRSCTR